MTDDGGSGISPAGAQPEGPAETGSVTHGVGRSATPTACPVCWSALPLASDGSGWVRCGHCGRDVHVSQAQVAERYREQAKRAAEYATYVEGVASGWRRVADEWRVAAEGAATAAVAPGLALGTPATPIPVHPQPSPISPTAAPIASAAESAPTTGPGGATSTSPRREIPTAVLLQGTGAVLILAAVVVVSAVAWTVLSPLGQVVLLASVVLVLGAVTVATRTRVPTTSMVLAALTTAVYVVVAITVPALQPQLNLRWYPFAAAALGAVLLLLAGRLGRVAFWRQAGIAGLPLTALLLPPAVLDLTGPAQWSLAALLLAVEAVALSELAVRLRGTDDETATTALWSAIALALVTAAATAVALTVTGVRVAASSLAERLWLAAAVTGLVVLLLFLGRLAVAAGRSPDALRSWAAGLLPLPVVILAMPVAYPSWPVALAPAGVVLVELLAGAWVWASSRANQARRGLAVAWLWGTVASAVCWGSFVGAGLIGDVSTARAWLWLAPHAVGLVIAAGSIGMGLLARSAALTAAGTAFAVVVWTSWFAGGHLGAEVEAYWLPVAGLVLAVGIASAARWPDAAGWRLPWRSGVLLVAGLPTAVVAVVAYAASMALPFIRIALLVGLAVAALLLDRRIRGALSLTVGVVAVEAAAFAFVALAHAGADAVEPYALVTAAATGLPLLAARREQFVGSRPVWIAAAGVLVGPSLAVAFLDPTFDAAWAGPRGVAVMAILGGVAAATRRRSREVSAAAGSVAIVLLAWWYVFWLGASHWADTPEAWTIPLASAVTSVLWLWTAAAGADDRRLLLAPAAVVLVVSTLVSVGVPLGSGGMWDDVRAVAVVVAWWGLAGVFRTSFAAFTTFSCVAVFLTWLQGFSVAVGRVSQPAFEVFTWSAAAAVALGTALIVWRAGKVPTSLVWLAPSLTLIMLPTALAAWSGGTAGWRVWFVLAAGTVALAVGVMRKWAGAVWPSLVALACVVVPVITRLASDAPAWVPLAIAGTALLALGARFESLRRQGRSAARWAATLD